MNEGMDPQEGCYAFECYTLDPARGALLGPRGEIRLRPKTYALLLYLVRNHGRLVGREELLNAAWGRLAVTDDSLTQCLVEIRRALRDDKRRIVRTVPRRGYLFDVEVTRPDPAGQSAVAPVTDIAAGPTDTPHPESSSPGMGRVGAVVVVVAATIAMVFGWALWPGARIPPGPSSEAILSQPNSIAVLPFVDLSAEHDQEYFGDGLAEEILNLLVNSRELKVIARTSSFSFKGQPVDIATIAAKLGVSHVLEGSVRKSGSRMRITAQLIAARDSAHLWSHTYDRELDDIFVVQTEIASAVANVLKSTLLDNATPAAEQRISGRAYDHYLQARFYFNRRDMGDLERAHDHFKAALAINPEYALAWADLSGVFSVQMSVGDLDRERGVLLRRQAAERALALDSRLPEAHIRAATAYFEDGDVERARHHFEMARALNPDHPLLLGLTTADLVLAGQIDEAIEHWDRILAADPLSRVSRQNRALHLMAAGRLEEARVDLRVARDLSPGRINDADVHLALILVLEERFAEAVTLLERAPEGRDRDLGLAAAGHGLGDHAATAAIIAGLQADDSSLGALTLAEISAFRGDHEQAFVYLAEAQSRALRSPPGDSWTFAIRVQLSPFLRPLHVDARFPASPSRIDHYETSRD
jgi:TolB-like protein/DNA-binding winged helix-turn-helix (wHTH) protein/lipoprotein NlpI